ncbi:MAG: hypothetical protein FK733_08675 [Asgard group archaeon]|nr:hypothetical protein [Asgard group archaeon]
MSDQENNVEEVSGQSRIFEDLSPKKAWKQLRGVIKDYEDYQTVPGRRKSDQFFRAYVMEYINQTNDLIKEIHALLIEKQQMSVWAVANNLINEIGGLTREIEKTDYGFTTFFENPKLHEMDISQLYIIEWDFIVTLKIMRERIESFMEIVTHNYIEDLDLWFETIDRLVGRVIKLNDDRAKLISSYERISY